MMILGFVAKNLATNTRGSMEFCLVGGSARQGRLCFPACAANAHRITDLD